MSEQDFNFTGIDKIVYGVDDLAKSMEFFDDWGLTPAAKSETGATYTTTDNTVVEVALSSDADLPPAFEDGPTLRRVVWGVKTKADLDRLENWLSTQEGYAKESEGPSITDPNGMRLSFRVTEKKAVEDQGVPVNVYGNSQRIDQRAKVYERAEPIKVGHVVFFAGDVMATKAFYESMGFVVSDYYDGIGYFLRCAKIGGHHDLFLLQTPDRKIGLNHVAFTVRDIDEVFGGGIHMSKQGWETQIGPGRHPISSAYFWYVHNPSGALAEYYTNEDHCTEKWEAMDWPRTNANFAEWAIAGGIDSTTRRQARGKKETDR